MTFGFGGLCRLCAKQGCIRGANWWVRYADDRANEYLCRPHAKAVAAEPVGKS